MREDLAGAQAGNDTNEYFVWYKRHPMRPAGQYLVNDQGSPVYLVDPASTALRSGRTAQACRSSTPRRPR